MAEIHSFSEVAPEFVKEVIPISFYVQDENWIDPKLETENYLCPAEYDAEPEFVEMVIPISAYERDEHLSYRDIDPDIFMPMVGKSHTAQILRPNQPGAIM